MGIGDAVDNIRNRRPAGEGAPISDEWNSEQQENIAGVYRALGLKPGEAQHQPRGGVGGGQQTFYTAPDDLDDPHSAVYLLPEEDGSVGVYSEPNPHSTRLRDATVEDAERAGAWEKEARELFESGGGSATSGNEWSGEAPTEDFNQFRYFPHHDRDRLQEMRNKRHGAPESFDTNRSQ